MTKTVAIIGGGPAGLMAADILSGAGLHVHLYERKASVGRKFLMAGRGGLNLTHSENLNSFIQKYGSRSNILHSIIQDFSPQALRDWCEALGHKTFIGSSGRVFPESFKASPLLRAWITRLEQQGVRFHLGHEWIGWNENDLIFQAMNKSIVVKTDATLLTLGGASWPRLGSDGSWVNILKNDNIKISPLRPANCGFCVAWSDIFKEKFSGQPLKPVVVSFHNQKIQGEMMMNTKGIEGGVVYALSASLRDAIEQNGSAQLTLDLKHDSTLAEIKLRLQTPRKGKSFTHYLRKTLKLSDVALGLLMESSERENFNTYKPEQLAHLIKNYPLTLIAPFSLERAISTAGGVCFNSVNDDLMLHNKPGVFVAGEMLDWEAPTGGYLLQASFATSVRAANGILHWLKNF